MNTIYVSHPDAKNHQPSDFISITEALASIPNNTVSPAKIYIRNGLYHEKFEIKIPNLILVGESVENTILTFGDYALMRMEDGYKRGTFRSQSVLIDADNFTAKNITFENSAGFGHIVGQAVALYVDGDRMTFHNCRMLGSQDTLFTGPLPKTAYEIGGFTGPKEFSERKNGRHYYHKCYIEGDIDFIFGCATAYFEDCEIFAKKCNIKKEVYSYLTAASTPEGQEYGYVFNNCLLTSNCPPRTVYLGRPWRDYAKTVFMNCEMGIHIKEEGWHDWNKEHARSTVYYAECNNSGDGYLPDKRIGFAKILTDEEASSFTKEKVLSGDDGWCPVPL